MSEDVPIVFIPKNIENLKFVQLIANGVDYMWFGKLKTEQHSEILKKMLDKLGIEYSLESGMPSLRGDKYDACGMGSASICEGDKLVINAQFSSYYYRKAFNPAHFERIKSALPQNLEVLID